MTRRENLLAALRREPHDRMPVITVIDGFNYPVLVPPELENPMAAIGYGDMRGQMELQRFQGCDVLMRLSPSCAGCKAGDGISDYTENNGLTVCNKTPSGVLRSVYTVSSDAHTTFKTEYPIKGPEDYAVAAEYFGGHSYFPAPSGIAAARDLLDMVGDSGIVYGGAPVTPVMHLASHWMGIENLAYALSDYPDETEALMALMLDKACEQYEIETANSPAEVFVFWDDCNSLSITRDMFERYSVPAMQRFSEICHRHGKMLVCHTCGKFDAFKELFLETGVDALDWVAPYPFGDIKINELQRVWRNKITPLLSIIPDTFLNGGLDDVEAHIHNLLDGADTDRLIFMLTSPQGAPHENLCRAMRVLERDYGYPMDLSERYGGNILTRPAEKLRRIY